MTAIVDKDKVGQRGFCGYCGKPTPPNKKHKGEFKKFCNKACTVDFHNLREQPMGLHSPEQKYLSMAW